MSCSLNFLKGGCIGYYTGYYYGADKEDIRSSDVQTITRIMD